MLFYRSKIEFYIRTGDLERFRILIGDKLSLYATQYNLLHLAAKYGDLDILKYLIDNNIDINTPSSKNRLTALYMAAQNGHLAVVQYLIVKGADINHRNVEGATALYISSQNGHTRIVKYLTDFSARINLPTNSGATPLFIASQTNRLDIVKILINSGAIRNIANNLGATAYIIAAYKGHKEILYYLANVGANPNLPVYFNNKLAVDIASNNNTKRMIEQHMVSHAVWECAPSAQQEIINLYLRQYSARFNRKNLLISCNRAIKQKHLLAGLLLLGLFQKKSSVSKLNQDVIGTIFSFIGLSHEGKGGGINQNILKFISSCKFNNR